MSDFLAVPKKSKIFQWGMAFLVLFLLIIPIKWFIYDPLHSYTISLSMTDIDQSTFDQKLLEIAAFKGVPETYSYVDNDHGNARSLLPGEKIDGSDSNTAKNGQYFQTSDGKYFYKEEGNEPVWKSCVYKDEIGKQTLLQIPSNCSPWTWLHIVSSNKSPDLLVYGYGTKTFYIIQSNGKILRYINNI